MFVFIAIIFIAARSIGGITLKSFVSDIKSTVSNLGAGDGYPYSFSGSEDDKIFVDGSKLFIFKSNKTMLLSKSAKVISDIPIEYGNAAVDYCDGKAVVFDRDSGRYRLQSCTEIFYENELKDKIISTAAVSKNGTCAVCYYDENFRSFIQVYNKSQKEIFFWKFSDEKITCVDISDDSKFAVVGTITSTNAVVNSKVYVFRFDSKEYVSCFDFSKSTVVNVSYGKSHDISVLTDKSRYYIEDNSTLCEPFMFNSDVLYKCTDNKSKFSSAALRKYGGDTFGTVKVFKGKDLAYSVDTDNEIKGVSSDGSNTAVLTSNSALLYNKKGELISEIKLDSSFDDIVLKGKKAYIINSVSVDRIKF